MCLVVGNVPDESIYIYYTNIYTYYRRHIIIISIIVVQALLYIISLNIITTQVHVPTCTYPGHFPSVPHLNVNCTHPKPKVISYNFGSLLLRIGQLLTSSKQTMPLRFPLDPVMLADKLECIKYIPNSTFLRRRLKKDFS